MENRKFKSGDIIRHKTSKIPYEFVKYDNVGMEVKTIEPQTVLTSGDKDFELAEPKEM